MDCSVEPTRHAGVWNITTTDFFFPLVEDPYLQGRIGCCNVLSDLYAMGVTDCDSMLMLVAASLDMPAEHRLTCTGHMMRGFNDVAVAAGTKVVGGQTVHNPWPIIGGVAQAIVSDSEFILPELGQAGDVLVLTKPLGTQVAVNVQQWSHGENWSKFGVEKCCTRSEAAVMYDIACSSMCRINRNGATLMRKHGARGCTDVTGFGLLGHAQNLCTNQRAKVDFVIHTLPCIRFTAAVNDSCFNFKLREGLSAETSGGLLAILPKASAAAFCKELEEMDGWAAHVIGDVVEGTGVARIIENAQIVETW